MSINNSARLGEKLIAELKIKAVGYPQHRVAELLIAGADANYKDACGYAPLHYAAMHHQPAATKMLLHYGADVNAICVNDVGECVTPLHLALQNGSNDSFLYDMLITAGSDVNGIDSSVPPLVTWLRARTDGVVNERRDRKRCAKRNESREVYKLLIAKRMRLDSADNTLPTPAHFAAAMDDVELLYEYMQRDGDIDTRCTSTHNDDKRFRNRTALRVAFECGSTAVLNALLKAGVHIEHSDVNLRAQLRADKHLDAHNISPVLPLSCIAAQTIADNRLPYDFLYATARRFIHIHKPINQ